jgi:hypothetical protein
MRKNTPQVANAARAAAKGRENMNMLASILFDV